MVTIDLDLQVVVEWADLVLWQAQKYALDGVGIWEETEMQLRALFSMTGDEYWSMTVREHARMVASIKEAVDGK